MNYYSLSGKNSNKFFRLNLQENKYYDWELVKKMAIEKNFVDPKEKDIVNENINNFQKIIDERRRREKNIKELLLKHNINFIGHSYVIRRHIMYNKGSTQNVIHIMNMMKILFERCDIMNKWEEYKIKENNQIYTFEEKDRFYKKIYDNFIRKNPRFKL